MEYAKYTEEDMDKLIDILTSSPKYIKGENVTNYRLTIEGIILSVDLALIKALVSGDEKQIMSFRSHTIYNLFNMIHTVPIEVIPLRINLYPEICKWRIEVGK